MTEPIVSIQNLKKAFGDHVVLDGINLNVMPGEKVVVLGPSGSGKSTMLRCINALEIPTSGAIFFNGVEVTNPKTDLNHVREHLGMVFQRFNLWPHKTVIENVMLPSSSFLKRIRRQPRPVPLNSSRASDFSTRPTPIRQAFRAVSSSALLLPAHLPWNPRLCSLTNRPLRLTRNSWAKCLPS